MAYQNSYGPPSMYNPGGGHPAHPNLPPQPPSNAGHQQHLQQLQQQQQFHPNPHPPYPHSNAPSSTYAQSPGLHGQGQISNGPRQQPQPYQNPGYGNNGSGNGNGGGALMAPPTTVPEDHFKKPYLPPQKQDQPRQTQQYMQNAPSLPYNYTNSQQQTGSAPASTPVVAAYSPQRPAKQIPTTNASHSTITPMTVSAPPVTSSAQSTPTSEAPSQPTDPASQASKLSPLDQERVDALFGVNNMLLQEVSILQQAGLKTPQSTGKPQSPQQTSQANASSPHPKPDGASTTPSTTDPSAAPSANPQATSTNSTPTTTTPIVAHQPSHNQRKFVEYMRRLQTNIFFLVSISDPTKQKPPYPSHLEALPNWLADGMKEEDKPQFDALKKGYEQLRELWPDWKPVQQQPQVQPQGQTQQQTSVQQSQSQQQQQHQQSQHRS